MKNRSRERCFEEKSTILDFKITSWIDDLVVFQQSVEIVEGPTIGVPPPNPRDLEDHPERKQTRRHNQLSAFWWMVFESPSLIFHQTAHAVNTRNAEPTSFCQLGVVHTREWMVLGPGSKSQGGFPIKVWTAKSCSVIIFPSSSPS